MNNRHYCNYDNGKLLAQEAFCQHLIALGRPEEIEDEHVNPMTIRLLVTRDNLFAIQSFCAEVRSKLNLAVASVNQLGIPGAQPVLSTVGTSVSGSISVNPAFTVPPGVGYPTFYTVAGLNAEYFHHVKDNINWYVAPNISVDSFPLHKALYQFFTNYMSSLDRIMYEINDLIPGTNADYFSQLADGGSAAVARLNANSFNALSAVTVRNAGPPPNLAEQVMQTNKYRRRITHDGIVTIKIDQATGTTYLPDDPEGAAPNFNVQVDTYCQEKFDRMLDLLNAIYAQLQVLIH